MFCDKSFASNIENIVRKGSIKKLYNMNKISPVYLVVSSNIKPVDRVDRNPEMIIKGKINRVNLENVFR